MNGMEPKWVREADAVVCGAGTAGCAAAVAAADQGLSVLLIEQFGAAGGSGHLGLVTPLMGVGIAGNPMCSYVGQEINARMVALGAATDDGSRFDPTMLGIVLEQMLMERGVHVLFHTTVTCVALEGQAVRAVQCFNKSGAGEARGRVFIDATGDADLCAFAGLPILHGDEETGKNQPVSLRYIVGGVDIPAFWAFLAAQTLSGQTSPAMPEYVSGAVTRGDGRHWPLSELFERAIGLGELTEEDATYWQFFGIPGRPDAIAFNCPEFFDLHDADDADSLTHVQLHGKQAILRQFLFYRKRLPGFERAHIAAIAPMVGVRESRRAVTEYVVTAEDLLSHRKFDDAICQSNYPVDVHGRKLNCTAIRSRGGDNPPYYEVPLRALVVAGVSNLMVAGRNLGAEFIAQSSIRIIPTCRAMGEAAGIAAAMALRMDAPVLRAVDGARVRAVMRAKGARFAGDA